MTIAFMDTLGARLNARIRFVFEPARRSAEYFARRRQMVAMVAIFGFPAYYFIWTYAFPQPFESLTLRLLGTAIFIPLVFPRCFPERWKAVLPLYWHGALLFALPFFFSYMLLCNGGTTVWVESTLVAIFVMLLLHDWATMVLHSALGILLGSLCFAATPSALPLEADLYPHIPVLLFAMVLGTVSNYANETVRLEQERVMLDTAGSIAHELRTPLLSIKSGAVGLRRHLPVLIATYQRARAEGWDVPMLRTAHLDAMEGVLSRIENEVNYANAIMEMLMATVRPAGAEPTGGGHCSVAACLELALKRYPFSEPQRRLVQVTLDGDIHFHGAELPVVHVIFNLLKNALRHIALAGKGDIHIGLLGEAKGRQLVFRDTASGIAPETLPHIFERFYSGSPNPGMDGGAGIGLAFCRDVMTGLGGQITCRSRHGEFTEFVLTFPEVSS